MARSLEIARLFYTLEAETKGLYGELGRAEKSLGRLGDFVKAHPVAAFGALGTVMIGVAFQATKMAAEVDTAIRRLGANVPDAVNRFDDLKGVAKDLSIEFGISQVEIVRAMEAIAKGGVDSVEDLIAATRAATIAAKATGSNFEGIVDGLDKVVDSFGLSMQDSEAILAKLFVTAQGKASLDELLAAFNTLSPAIERTGVDFNTAAAAMATLIDRGRTAKQAVSELNKLDLDGIRQLASQSKVASDGLAEMRAQADLNNNSLESLTNRLKEQFNAALIELGAKVLPRVIELMQFLNSLFSVFDGSVKKIETASAVQSINQLSTVIGKVSGKEQQEAVKRLTDAIEVLGGGSFAKLNRNIRDVADENLPALRKGLEAAAKSGALTGPELQKVSFALGNVAHEIERRGNKPLVPPIPGEVKRGLDEVVAGTGELTEAQKTAAREAEAANKKMAAAAEEFAKKHAAAMKKVKQATIEASATLTDNLQAAIEDLREELRESGLETLEVIEALQSLEDELDLVRIKEKLELPEILAKSVDELNNFDIARLHQATRELEHQALFADRTGAGYAKIKAELALIAAKLDEVAVHTQRTALKTGDWTQLLKDAGYEFDALGNVLAPKVLLTTDEILQVVSDTAHEALAIAEHFGLIDSRSANVLQNIIGIADGIRGIAVDGFDLSDLPAVAGVIGNLAGVIAGLFGDSPTARAREELIRRNNEVLAELVRVNGDLVRINQPGAKLVAAQEALAAALAGLVIPFDLSGTGKLEEKLLQKRLAPELLKVGLTLTELEEIGKALGFSIRNAVSGRLEVEGVQALLDALRQIDTQFGDTFAEQMDRIRSALTVGVLEPSQEFAAILEVLQREKSAAPAITEALTGINVFTPEGRQAAIQSLQQLFKDLTAGALSKEAFGGLTAQQFIDTIEQLVRILQGTGELKPLTRVPGGELPPLTFPEELPPGLFPQFPDDFGALVGEQTELAAASLSVEEQQLAVLQQILAQLGPTDLIAPAPETTAMLAALQGTEEGTLAIVEALQGLDLSASEGRETGVQSLRALLDSIEVAPSAEAIEESTRLQVAAIEELIRVLQAAGDRGPVREPADDPRLLALQAIAEDLRRFFADLLNENTSQSAALTAQLGLSAEALALEREQAASLQGIEALLASLTSIKPLVPPSLPEGILTTTGPSAGASVSIGSIVFDREAIVFQLEGGVNALIDTLAHSNFDQVIAAKLMEAIIRIQGQLTLRV